MTDFDWTSRCERARRRQNGEAGFDAPDYESFGDVFSDALSRRQAEPKQEPPARPDPGSRFGPIQQGALRRARLLGAGAEASSTSATSRPESDYETARFNFGQLSTGETPARETVVTPSGAAPEKEEPGRRPVRDGGESRPRLWNFMESGDKAAAERKPPPLRPRPVRPPEPSAAPTPAHRQLARDAVFGDVVGRDRLAQLKARYPGLTEGGSDEEALGRLRQTEKEDRTATGPAATPAGEEASDPYAKAPYLDLPANARSASKVKRAGGEAEIAKAEAARKERIHYDVEPGALTKLVGEVARDLAQRPGAQVGAQSLSRPNIPSEEGFGAATVLGLMLYWAFQAATGGDDAEPGAARKEKGKQKDDAKKPDPKSDPLPPPPPGDKPEDEDDEEGEEVDYFRVQGGAGAGKSRERVAVRPDGGITITRKGDFLHVSVEDPDHARYYLRDKRVGGYVIAFDVPIEIHRKIIAGMVLQEDRPKGRAGGRVSQRDDPTSPGIAVGAAPLFLRELEAAANDAELITEDEFFRRFGHDDPADGSPEWPRGRNKPGFRRRPRHLGS